MYITGHHTRMPHIRTMHSKRMLGNTLYAGHRKPESARRRISELQKGSGNSVWRGGKIIAGDGYVSILKPEHPFADINGRIKEERLVMEAHLDRYLSKDEIVHHINHIRTDNRIENLRLMTRSEHSRFHATEMWARRQLRDK